MDRSKSSRIAGMRSTLSWQGRQQRKQQQPHPSTAADWLSSRNQHFDPSSSNHHSKNHILLALELRQDGGRDFLHASVRGLYRYVMEAITTPFKVPTATNNDNDDASTATPSTSPRNNTVNDEPTATARNNDEDDEMSREDLTYRERLGGYLHPRDLRRLTSPFSASNEPELMVRRHVILCNFDPLRAIILRDRLLVIVPEGADGLLVDLERRVRGGIEEVENSVFGDAAHEEDVATMVQRYKKKPTGPLAAKKKIGKAVKDSVKKSATYVKNVMGRHSGHGSVTLPPTTATTNATTTTNALASSESSAPNSTATMGMGATDNDDASINTEQQEFAELESSEWEELKGNNWKELPFELQCADAVLHVVTNGLYEETYDLQQAALTCIHNIVSNQNGLSDEPLVDIRRIKDILSEMESRVNRYMTSIDRILDEDEALALMNLTRLMLHPERFVQSTTEEILEEEASEPSFVIEAHLSTAYTLQNVLHLIKGQIDSASELVDRKQDAARNKILLANTIISVFSLCVGSASLVGSFFGMNLTNHLETNGNAWAVVLGSTMAMSVVIGVFGIWALIWSGALPRMAVLFRQA